MLVTETQRQRVAQFVRDYLLRTAVNYGHKNATHRATARWMHTINVLQNLKMILDGEGAPAESREVCEIAAIFHDVDHYTVELQYHAIRGAETAKKFLIKEGLPAAFAERVAEAVRGHHHDLDDDIAIETQVSAIAAQLSHEARMVMDAETLDKIGATNILQSVMTLSQVKHPQLHEIAREMTAGWPLERARLWQMTLLTPTGKIMGAQRLAFYEQFLKQISDEVVMHDPYPQPSARTQESLQVP